MANYKKQYDKMRRTRLEKACITIQIAAGIGFLITGALQTTLLTHTNPYAMVKYQFCFMAAYFAFIGIAIACAVIRTVEHGKRKAFDLTHRAGGQMAAEHPAGKPVCRDCREHRPDPRRNRKGYRQKSNPGGLLPGDPQQLTANSGTKKTQDKPHFGAFLVPYKKPVHFRVHPKTHKWTIPPHGLLANRMLHPKTDREP